MVFSAKRMAAAPVNAVVFLVSLPYSVLLYLVSIVRNFLSAVVSVPVCYASRTKKKFSLLWRWTLARAERSKLYVPWARGCTESELDLSVVPRTSPVLGLKEGHQRRDLGVSRCSSKRRQPIWKSSLLLDLDSRERLGESRVDLAKPSRKMLLSYLLKTLLQPSPPSSDEEDSSTPSTPSTPEEMERNWNHLIHDLVKISNAYSGSSRRRKSEGERGKKSPGSGCKSPPVLGHCEDDKERLQALIWELERLKEEEEGFVPLVRKKQSKPTGVHHVTNDVELDKSGTSSPVVEEGEREGEEQEPSVCITSVQRRASLIEEGLPQLSPLNESPELLHSGSEPGDWDSELTLALQDLDEAVSGLAVHAGAEPLPECGADEAVSGLAVHAGAEPLPECGADEQEDMFADAEDNRPSELKQEAISLPTDAFLSIPVTNPVLGLKEGRDRRQLATARNARPPTRKQEGEDQPSRERAADRTLDSLSLETSSPKQWGGVGRSVLPPLPQNSGTPSSIPAPHKKTFKLTSSQPPWLEMAQKRQRNADSTSSESSKVDDSSFEQPAAASESLYDSLEPLYSKLQKRSVSAEHLHDKSASQRPAYLHQSFAPREQKEMDSPPPELPPPRRSKGVRLGLRRGRSEDREAVPSCVKPTSSEQRPSKAESPRLFVRKKQRSSSTEATPRKSSYAAEARRPVSAPKRSKERSSQLKGTAKVHH